MKQVKENIYFILYKTCGNNKLINSLVKRLYLFFFFILKLYLTQKFKTIVSIYTRNSIQNNDFSFVLSDLDFTIIIANESEISLIVNAISSLKKIFIFIDFPEIYLESEYSQYLKLNPIKYQQYLDFCWHIRKIHWLEKKINSSNSEFEKFKLKKSIKRSFSKIFKNYTNEKKFYELNEFLGFEQLSQTDKDCCYLSPFLELNHESSFQICLSKSSFEFLNTIMPRETIPYYQLEEIPVENLKIKQIITFHEYLISKTSIYFKKHLGINIDSNSLWCNQLQEDLAKIQQIVASSYNIQ